MDIGCPDFEQAKRNREMIAKKRNITGYQELEGIKKRRKKKVEELYLNTNVIIALLDTGLPKIG